MHTPTSSMLSRIKTTSNEADDFLQSHGQGLSEELIRAMSAKKNEPQWVLDKRLEAYKIFLEKPLPQWGPDLSDLDLDKIYYYSRPESERNQTSWETVDPKIKKTFERLRIPEAEREVLAGVGAQYDSENVYHNLKNEWKKKGVLFEDFDIAIQKYPEIVREYFGTCISPRLHKFSALHYALFSGGTFLYIPKNVEITQPLQSYFRMNTMAGGQFEHTMIIVDEGATAGYIEGCSAPKYGTNSLHAGAVEVFVKKGARMRYSSVENWSLDTYNLNTKRALVYDDAHMEWIGGNFGSATTMLYPCAMLIGDNARCEYAGVAFAGENQHQDTGARIMITGKNCRASILSKSLSKDGGNSTYRGDVTVSPSADNALISVVCDALMLDDVSISDTIPVINCENSRASITHEASAGTISEELVAYFASRGIKEEAARGIIVNGFLNEVIRTLPLEYASELNRLMEMEMEGGW